STQWEHEKAWLKNSLHDTEKRLDKALEAEKDYRIQLNRIGANHKEALANLTWERDDLQMRLEESETLLTDLIECTQLTSRQMIDTQPITTYDIQLSSPFRDSPRSPFPYSPTRSVVTRDLALTRTQSTTTPKYKRA